ncbi:MAG: triacylglycerol lipase [Lachnospiraceae bacterium]|nr:triacylglycerol lipase [Lachnospiraceae bacterium]
MKVLHSMGHFPGVFALFSHPFTPYLFCTLFVAVNILPSIVNRKLVKRRHRILADGEELLILFLTLLTIFTILAIAGALGLIIGGTRLWNPGMLAYTGGTLLSIVVILSVIFWNGIIRIYMTSVQLGIRYRVLGIIFGWIFPVNLYMLSKMIRIVSEEVDEEEEKISLNASRHSEELCHTRYPLLLVHGVFFRDFKQGFLNYWGRIPDELKENGATVYYGSQQSAASVAKCGAELAERIRTIVRETGCEKVNIIAHSKGGLDSRYAIANCGVSDLVASLTTINTPHRGCEFADYLLEKIPEKVKQSVASAYNAALLRFGDHAPDFLEAVYDLTHASCAKFNEEVKDVPGIFYQSVGSRLDRPGGGRFPLNYSFRLVKYFDGRNDGLVGENSFPWGERYQYLEPMMEMRGISHGDMIDLNRENLDGFDVREFYVQLVKDLKERGL